MAMTKCKTKLEDGRYLIYFEFDKKAAHADASGQKASRSIGARSGRAPSRPGPAQRPDATDSAAGRKGDK